MYHTYASAVVPSTQEEFLEQLKDIARNYTGCKHTPEVIDSLHTEIRHAFRVCYEGKVIDTIPQIYVSVNPLTRQVEVTTSKFVWGEK